MIQEINHHKHDLDFVAPLSPKTCAQQLSSFSNPRHSLTSNTRVKIKRFKNGSYYFKITRSIYQLPTYRRFKGYGRMQIGRSNYVKLHLNGYLVRWADSGSTIVIGESKIDTKTYIINGMFLLFFALGLLGLSAWLFLAEFFFCAPLVVFMLVSFAHTTVVQPETLGERHAHNLMREVTQILRESETTLM